MTWIQEHKEVLQSHYGGYCIMCRELNLVPIPYHSFTMEIYDEIYRKAKSYRKAKNND